MTVRDDMSEIVPVLDRLECLSGRSYLAEPLPGGLTNRNYKVTAGADVYVVRVSHPDAGLLAIDRDAEYRNSVAAARAGVGAPVVEYRPGEGVLVVGFLPGATCTRQDIAGRGRLARVVDACRRLHAGPRFVNDFDMFRLQPYYLSIVQERGFRLPDRYLSFSPLVDRIRAALVTSERITVPCHNDLLAENCLDDGTRAWLIDYEYSGNNDPCFELGNLWSESGLSLEQLEEIVCLYYGRPDPRNVARARLHGMMSKYGWALWASIQASVAELDFDFWGWGMEKYERVLAEFTSDAFESVLDTAGGCRS